MNSLQRTIVDNRNGSGSFVPSICSAHRDVLAASMRLWAGRDAPLIIEATSNQANQFGGYTGMTPADFVHFVHEIANETNFPQDQLIFGGDHLGTQVWKDQDPEIAMEHAKEMMKAYVKAGFTKIHLDCSEGCKGEAAQLNDEISSARAATLAHVCEREAPSPESLTYIVGTEVPPPGGARLDHGAIVPTNPENAKATLAAQKSAFAKAGLAHIWPRVIGLVVQPGLEFGAEEIYAFPKDAPDELAPVIADEPHLCFEAHSTDYQQPWVFEAIAKRHFAIQKVGPALTFAYREAIYALSSIDTFLTGHEHISDRLELAMTATPKYWQNHYDGDDSQLKYLRHFGFADRIRYYWPQVHKDVDALERRLETMTIPAPMLWQYFDEDARARASRMQHEGISWVKAYIYAKIQSRLCDYLPDEQNGVTI